MGLAFGRELSSAESRVIFFRVGENVAHSSFESA